METIQKSALHEFRAELINQRYPQGNPPVDIVRVVCSRDFYARLDKEVRARAVERYEIPFSVARDSGRTLVVAGCDVTWDGEQTEPMKFEQH
jgi:hypothetical protein